jgi:hypothetical protein
MIDPTISPEENARRKKLWRSLPGRERLAFANMTDAEHAAMKAKLLALAESGAPRPGPDTLEGYALRQYTETE